MASSIVDKPLYLTDFTSFSILEYAEQFPALTGNTSVVTKIKKGSLMFNERFVSKIFFSEPDESRPSFEITATVKAEMKKKVSYATKVQISTDCKVLTAICECKAGAEPAGCKHVFALLHAVEDYSKREMYFAPTERLQVWHQPKPVKLSPQKASAMFGKQVNKVDLKNREFDWSALKDLNIALMRCANDSVDVKYERTLSLPAVVFAGSLSSGIDTNIFTCMEDVFLFHGHYIHSLEFMNDLEKKTMSQGSDEWKNMRLKYITSTSVHSILSRRADFEKLAERIYLDKKKDLSTIAAVSYGQHKEHFVRGNIEKKYSEYTVRRTGLVLSPFFPYLSASPDGLMCKNDDAMLLEIKCLFNPGNLSLEELSSTRGNNFCLELSDGKYQLKKKHKYYKQVQTQLAVTNLTKCLFVVYYCKDGLDNFHEEIIDFNPAEWALWNAKLRDFFFHYYFPFLSKSNILS